MGMMKRELLDIAQAFGEAGHDLATEPERAVEITESVAIALNRLRRLCGLTVIEYRVIDVDPKISTCKAERD